VSKNDTRLGTSGPIRSVPRLETTGEIWVGEIFEFLFKFDGIQTIDCRPLAWKRAYEVHP
jgi:hypothetical protein